MINEKVMTFIVKVGIPTGFAIVLLLYVLNTTTAREERLINIIQSSNAVITNDQLIMIKQDDIIDNHLDNLNKQLQVVINNK